MIVPAVFAVILNYNGFEDTKRCVLSLQQVTYAGLSLVIVDNFSPDNSFQLLTQEFPKIPVLKTPENLGYAGGMNTGARYALEQGSDYILFLNNDMTFSPDFIEPLVDAAEKDFTIGMISPKVLYMDKPELIYCAGAEFHPLRACAVSTNRLRQAETLGNQSRKITSAEGSCIFIRKKVFESVGFMSEKYFMYLEDLDYSFRVRKFFSIHYLPQSVVFHKSGAGAYWHTYSDLYHYYFNRNRLLLFADFNFFYRLYVVLFSLCNAAAKSVIIISKRKERSSIKRSLSALWKGTTEGLVYILRIKKPKDDKPLKKNQR